MSSDQAIVYLDRLSECGPRVNVIRFFGGEPLLNVDCIRAVCEYFTKRFLKGDLPLLPRFHVNTGLSVGVGQLAELVDAFGVTVTVGIDGAQEVHDAQRAFPGGSGSFALVDRNLEQLIARCNQPRSLEVVFTGEHVRRGLAPVDIHRFLTGRYGCRNIMIHPAVPVLTFDKHRVRESNAAGLSARHVRRVFHDYGNFLFSKNVAERGKLDALAALEATVPLTASDTYCDTGFGQLAIRGDGELFPCSCFCGHPDFSMGSIADRFPMTAGKFQSIRRRVQDNTKSRSPVCNTCDIATTCSSCPAAMLHRNGAMNAPIETICAYRMGMTEGALTGFLSSRQAACTSTPQ